MEVKIEIDASHLSNEVKEIFSVLTTEEKKIMANEVMRSVLIETKDLDKPIYEEKILKELKEDSYNKNKSDEQIKNGYQFNDKMKYYKSYKNELMDALVKEVKEYAKEHIKELIANDPEIKKATEETMNYIKSNFSAFVHDAMVAHFCQSMNTVTQGIGLALTQTEQLNRATQELHQRLINKGM